MNTEGVFGVIGAQISWPITFSLAHDGIEKGGKTGEEDVESKRNQHELKEIPPSATTEKEDQKTMWTGTSRDYISIFSGRMGSSLFLHPGEIGSPRGVTLWISLVWSNP
jgi:hypothetical protein